MSSNNLIRLWLQRGGSVSSSHKILLSKHRHYRQEHIILVLMAVVMSKRVNAKF